MTADEVIDLGRIVEADLRDIGRLFADGVEQVCLGGRFSEPIERHTVMIVVEVEASRCLPCGRFGGPAQ